MFFPLRMARIALAAVMALSCTLAAQATEFITDVMVIGARTEGQINLLKVTYESKGWTVIDNDLNKGCGGNSDYVYLLYKSEENTDGLNHGYITDFYISDATGTVPDDLTYDGHTYHLVAFDGDDPPQYNIGSGSGDGSGEFKASKGDLNSGTSGVNIHLYYTREQFTDNRTASAIVFNDTKNESVVWNGNGEHADLNKGCGSGSAYIYMYVDTYASAFPGYIKDVMLIGGTGDEVNTLKTTLTAQGWKVINHDLNAGCGSSSDYIYLLYKSENSTDGYNYGYITDFYISNATGTPPDDLTYDGRTYHLVPFDGGSHFKEKKGDLNSNAGGDDIHLYYTKRLFTDKRTVTNISFKNIKSGAVGVNGGSEGYDLNKNAGGNDIFMHLTTGTTLAPFSGSGTADVPFIINSAADWSRFVTCISKGAYVDMYYKLTANISVTEMVGTSEHPFAGHFDGDGHTLTVNINSSEMGAAPFHYVKNATIEKLTVGGTVAASAYHAAGLAGLCYGNLTITGCAVSANINASGYAGGMVGHGGSSTISISDSFYSGAISGFKNYAGGLIGWGEALTLTMTNCLFKGSFSPASGGKYHPIACKNADKTATATVTGTYYLNTITPTATGNYIVPGAEGRPASTTCIIDSWDAPVTAADGITYYLLFTGKRLPYEYGFENNDPIAEGWMMVDCGNDTGILWSTYSWHYYFAFNRKSGSQYLVSPEFNGLSGILVRFYYQSNGSASFQVGYSTTTPDIDAFIFGETNTATKIWEWELYEGNYPKGTKYIAIKWIPGFPLYIDNFSFTVCDTPSPVNLSAIDITEYTASPSWEAPPAPDYPITGYAYQYKKASDEEWSAEATVTGTSVTINGLSANTDYQFRVKAFYGTHGESIYTPIQFITAMELPYELGFENGMDRWSMVDCPSDYTKISTEAARDGENGFMFRSWITAPQYLISPRFAGTSEMTVSFYYRDRKPDSGYWETFQVGYSTTTNDPSDFTWSDDVVATNIPWTLYEHTFPIGTRYIAVAFIQTYSNGLYIDDFSFVEYSAYAKPTGLAVSDLTDQSVKLTWTVPDASVTGYAYQYKKSTDDAWSTETTVNTTSVTLDGLDANTTYDFRVKALYADDNASNYVTVRFLTEGIVNSLPYNEGFENDMGGWRASGNLSEIYSRNSDYIHGGNSSFELDQNETLISPLFDVSTSMLVSFYYKNFKNDTGNYRTRFQVGYSFKTKDLTSFLWGDIETTKAEWQKLSIYCPEGTKYVAIKWIEGYSIYLDDFTFTVGTTPPVPHDIAVTNLTAYSADISWTGDAEMYDVRFRQKPLLFEDFENGLDQWKVVNQGGTSVTDWHIEQSEGSDNHYAIASSYDNETKTSYTVDNWLISPQVTLDGTLSFVATQNPNFLVHYEVWVSTITDDTSSFKDKVFERSYTDGKEYEKVSIDLSSYSGKKGYIAIRLNDYDRDYLAIDNVSISKGDLEWKTVTTRNYAAFRAEGLQPFTDYEFQVRSRIYNYLFEWSDVVTFTTNNIAPLYDDKDNTELINVMADAMAASTDGTFNVMLVHRTLYRGGTWNTLCLPFGVSDLSGTPLDGAKVKTLGSTDLSDDGTLTLKFTDATGIEAGKPYLLKWDLPIPDLIIRSAAEWEAFAQNVNNGTESYEGKLVQLGKDISISTMAGTADHPFCGTFDGAGYTLNVSINNSGADYAAPLRYINGATIRNLKVTGSVNGGQYSAGIVGAALGGTNSIRDCWMAASVTGQDHVGGILGHGTTSATTISNCYLTGSLNSSYIGVLYGWGSAGGKQAVANCWARGDYPSFIIGGSINLVLTDGGTVSVTNCYQNIGEYAQGDEEKVIIITGGGSIDTYYATFLGSQWQVDDNGSLALKHATEVSITSPVFRYVRVSNALTPVATDHVNFIGITSPATLAADDSSLLYLDTDNALHHPDADMTLNACRGYFQLSDPNATINAIVLNFDSILPGDVNGDGKVTPADAIMILYHYFNVVQNGFNVKAADLNNDGHVTPADAIEALYLYFGSSSKARATSPMVNSSCDPE